MARTFKFDGQDVEVPGMGRIVWYSRGQLEFPAIVLRANVNGFADLTVFGLDGKTSAAIFALAVSFHPSGTEPNTWRWPVREP